MRTRLISLSIGLLMVASFANAQSVGEGPIFEFPWGVGYSLDKLPTGSAMVRTDCAGAEAPCYETICGDVGAGCVEDSAIYAVETALPAGNRFVYVYPGTYTEDVSCDLGTGHTTILGMGAGQSANAQSAMAHIIGVTGGVDSTVNMRRCTIDRMFIEQGPDDFDEAIQIDAGMTTSEKANIIDSLILNNQAGVILGSGDQLIRAEHSNGNVSIINSRMLGLSSGCAGDCAVIYVDTGGTVEIIGGDNGLLDVDPADGGAFMQISSGKVLVQYGLYFIDGDGTHTNSLYEIDDEDATLFINGSVNGGGLGTKAGLSGENGRFITVTGAGGGSLVTMSNLEGPGWYTVASSWGSIVRPAFRGSCENQISMHFNPDETTERYYSLSDFAQSAGGGESDVDDYVTGGPFLAHSLHVESDVAPDNGANTQSWTVTLRDASTPADTKLTCSFSEAETGCDSVAALNGNITSVADNGVARITSAGHRLSTGDTIYIQSSTNYDGIHTVTKFDDDLFDITDAFVDDSTGRWVRYEANDPVAGGTKLAVEVTPDAGGGLDPAAAAEMVVSFCLSGFPK